MFDLIRMERELKQAIRIRDEWEMNGYDTPYLTYHEQLEMYQERLEILANQIRKELE